MEKFYDDADSRLQFLGVTKTWMKNLSCQRSGVRLDA